MAKKDDVLTEDDDNVVDTTEQQTQQTQQQQAKEPEIEVVEAPVAQQADEGDERLDVTGAADEEDDDRHEGRRETAKERRARAKLAKERDRKELEFQRLLIKDLENKLANVSKQTITAQALALQQQLQTARDEEQRFASVSEQAQRANNVTDAFAAERIRDDASRRAAQLQGQLQNLARQHAAPMTPQPPAFIPYAKQFAEGKPWYDPNGRNEDSAIVLAIDKVLANEPGQDPRTPGYWAELEKRVAKRLPQHFKNNSARDEDVDLDDDQPTERTRRGPPVGGGRSNASTNATQIRLSPERVAAMKAANIWDDPVMRQKVARRYAEFDRNNKTSARR